MVAKTGTLRKNEQRWDKKRLKGNAKQALWATIITTLIVVFGLVALIWAFTQT